MARRKDSPRSAYFLDTYTKMISLILDIPSLGYPKKWAHDICSTHGNGHTSWCDILFGFIF